MELINSASVGAGGATSIQFSSIPQTYTDLVLLVSVRSGSSADTLFLRINGSTSSTTSRILQGDGSSVAGSSNTSDTYVRFGTITSGATASTFSSGLAYLPNYTGSANKTVSVDYVSENNNDTVAYQTIVGGTFPITAAITSLLISNTGSSIAQYSTAYLYGILKGSGGATVS